MYSCGDKLEEKEFNMLAQSLWCIMFNSKALSPPPKKKIVLVYLAKNWPTTLARTIAIKRSFTENLKMKVEERALIMETFLTPLK